MERRGCGVLLHISSLPSPYGIGDLGPGAYDFVNFLVASGQSYWQILPLNPTCTVFGSSPYSSFSAYAGNQILISPELMVKDGFISDSDIKKRPAFSNRKVSYEKVARFKNRLFEIAYKKNRDKLADDQKFQSFCSENSFWLDDYSFFIAVKQHFNGVQWSQWPEGLRNRREGSVKEWRTKLAETILREQLIQFIFFKQWHSLKCYCENKNIQIIGDMPMYVNYDSSDMWASPEIFRLNKNKKPVLIAGVPPDYFSSTGQLWGHPVYDWDALKKTHYLWWIRRIEYNLKLFHMFRLDHFRGFIGYWTVRATENTAINGKWVNAPARDFFNTLFRHFAHLPLIAEDLGVITPDVREVMNKFGFPGMRVLLFAFGKDLSTNPYAPHNYIKNCVVYTGTHDNNTIKGWFKKEIGPEERKRISEYVGNRVTIKNIHMELIKLAMMSVANMVIIPMQDILGLGENARMNQPATLRGNWTWRFLPEQLSGNLIKRLSGMAGIYGRV